MNSTPSNPSKETVRAISPPWWQRAGVWTALAGGVSTGLVFLNAVLPDLVHTAQPFLTDHQSKIAFAVAAGLGILTGHLNGWRGVNAAARVEENRQADSAATGDKQ